MATELRFDGKVAVITGAGGGLGRAHALLFASRGAKVVVNDLGGGFTGDGKGSGAADKVVDEIKAAGGTAVANYDSVTDGDRIIKTAIDAFGRIDILVNNAGILRDVSFAKMTQADWDKIYDVHVQGAFRCTHAAFPYMRDQGYGRIIMTSSAAGIYGNFGQANYAMAKLGLVGFAQTIAIEGRKRNVLCNTIAPIAGSRMTETVLPQALLEALRPDVVAPLVARLCHEASEETGGLFEVGGGFFAKLRWERTVGKTFRIGRAISPEDVDSAWPDITDFTKSTHPESIAASMGPIMENVEAGASKGGNQFIDVDAALGYQFPSATSSYDERDLAIYALGVGAATDPGDDRDLQLVYELHGKGMKALPTYAVIPALNQVLAWGKEGKQAPGLNFGLDRILHGEQYTELRRPLPRKATLTHKARIKDIFDKGKIALVVNEFISYDEDGHELIRNEVTTAVRGAGGWGGDRGPSAEINVPPDRAPDKVIEERIPKHQALLYRLSGDWNPLHADPGFAKAFGFERPILHGLCSFGYAGRHVIAGFAPGGDPDYFKSIRTRFANPVMPGETMITEMWQDGPQRVIFRSKVKERDVVVISNAAVEFWKEIPKAPTKAKPATASAPAAAATSADIFRAIGGLLTAQPAIAEKTKTVFQFRLSAPASVWTLDAATAPGAVTEGEGAKPACTLEISDADFMAMATGQADAMKLFSTGKLKISGDVMASQKLGFLKKLTPDMVAAEVARRTGGASTAGAAPAALASAGEPTVAEVVAVIADHVAKNPDLVAKVGCVYLWNLTSPNSSWTLDLKNGLGSATVGGTTGECTLEIAERDFMDLTAGKADAMKLFTTGKLKISGNVMASQKLEFLRKLDPKRAAEVVAKLRGAAGPVPATGTATATAATPAAAATTSAPGRAAEVFTALQKRLAENPRLLPEVAATLEFVVRDPSHRYTLAAAGSAKVDATVTVTDADLLALVTGRVTAQALFQRGGLRIDGDVAAVHRLLPLLKDLLA